MGLSLGHLLLLLVIVLVLFGAGRIPQMMADLAKGIRAFKEGMRDDDTAGSQMVPPPPLDLLKAPKKDAAPVPTRRKSAPRKKKVGNG